METQDFLFSLEKLQKIIDGALPADEEYKKFIIRTLEKKDHKFTTIDEIYSTIDGVINQQTQAAKNRIELLKKMLTRTELDSGDIEKIIGTMNSLEHMSLMLLNSSIKANLRIKIGALVRRLEKMPSVERTLKAKAPKTKKPAQIEAEELAKDLWKKAPRITQENMAYQIKDKLDLTQTIQTIIRWIKPFQPPK